MTERKVQPSLPVYITNPEEISGGGGGSSTAYALQYVLLKAITNGTGFNNGDIVAVLTWFDNSTTEPTMVAVQNYNVTQSSFIFAIDFGDFTHSTELDTDQYLTITELIGNVSLDVQNLGTKLDTVNSNIGTTNTSLTTTNSKLDTTNGKLDVVNSNIGSTNTKLDTLHTDVGTTIHADIVSTNSKLDITNTRVDLTNTNLTSTNTKLDTLNTTIGTTNTELGATNESAASTDTSTSGINGLLKRIAQRLTSLIGLFPTSLGQKTKANSFPVVLASDSDGLTATIGASENHLGEVGGKTIVKFVTLSLDTGVGYASGEVLADTQAVTSVFRVTNGTGLLQSIILNDKDDQGAALDIVILDANVSLGTENSTVSITDANADSILGIISVVASDWLDLGGTRSATIKNIGLPINSESGSTSLYIGAITRGTPSHTASGITLRLGILLD